jgi:hypothetical protein
MITHQLGIAPQVYSVLKRRLEFGGWRYMPCPFEIKFYIQNNKIYFQEQFK